MTVRAVWHFSFTVADLDRSIGFYRDRLGMELVRTQRQDNDYTRRLVGYPDARLRIAQLRLAGWAPSRSGHHLELVQYLAPRGVRGDPGMCNPGAAHLAFEVDDIHAHHARLSAAGVPFVSPPNAITAGINEGGFTCYFRDPDDITLELVQPPSDGAGA